MTWLMVGAVVVHLLAPVLLSLLGAWKVFELVESEGWATPLCVAVVGLIAIVGGWVRKHLEGTLDWSNELLLFAAALVLTYAIFALRKRRREEAP